MLTITLSDFQKMSDLLFPVFKNGQQVVTVAFISDSEHLLAHAFVTQVQWHYKIGKLQSVQKIYAHFE